MKEFSVKVNDPVGIHARPAGMLVKESSQYVSDITIILGEKSANAKKIFSVMQLAAKHGDTLKIIIKGEDEETAAENLKHFFNNNL